MAAGGPVPNPFKPETDINALVWRVKMFWVLLDAARQLPEQMPAILRENPLPEIVFRTIADVPMSYAVTRTINNGWPFDHPCSSL